MNCFHVEMRDSCMETLRSQNDNSASCTVAQSLYLHFGYLLEQLKPTAISEDMNCDICALDNTLQSKSEPWEIYMSKCQGIRKDSKQKLMRRLFKRNTHMAMLHCIFKGLDKGPIRILYCKYNLLNLNGTKKKLALKFTLSHISQTSSKELTSMPNYHNPNQNISSIGRVHPLIITIKFLMNIIAVVKTLHQEALSKSALLKAIYYDLKAVFVVLYIRHQAICLCLLSELIKSASDLIFTYACQLETVPDDCNTCLHINCKQLLDQKFYLIRINLSKDTSKTCILPIKSYGRKSIVSKGYVSTPIQYCCHKILLAQTAFEKETCDNRQNYHAQLPIVENLITFSLDKRKYICGIIQCSGHISYLTTFLITLQKYCNLLKCVINLGFIILQNTKTYEDKSCSLNRRSIFPTSKLYLQSDKKSTELNKHHTYDKHNCRYVPVRLPTDNNKTIDSSDVLRKIVNSQETSYYALHWVYPISNPSFTDMSNELQRLGTFHIFPKGNCPSFIKMARAGFFYTGDKRIALCFSCEVSNSDWSYHTNPIELHRELSPKCVYLNMRFPMCEKKFTEGGHKPTTFKENILKEPTRLPYISTDPGSNIRQPSDSGISRDTGAFQNQSFHSSRNGGLNSNLVRSRDSGYGSGLSLNNQSSHNTDIQTDHHATALPAISEEHQQNGNSVESRRTIENPTASSDMISKLPPPRYQEYQLLERRKATYKNWPQHLNNIIHPFDLSECGFFYSNFGDCVRCYQCGIGLRNWESDDNPWVEHARWSKRCPYLIQRKGQKFIDTVLKLLGIQTDSEIEELSNTPSEPLISAQAQISIGSQWKPDADPLTHEAAKLVIREKMFPVNVVKLGMDELLKHNEWKSITSDMLVLHLTEKNKASDLMVSEQQVFSAPLNSVEQTNRNVPQNELMHTNENSYPEKTMTTELNSVVNPETVQKENEELKDLYTCKICLDEKVGITFVPCGHLVTCKKCSPKIRRCPLCRTFIRGTIKTTV